MITEEEAFEIISSAIFKGKNSSGTTRNSDNYLRAAIREILAKTNQKPAPPKPASPHTCPVCRGKGRNMNDYEPASCSACQGTCIVWQPLTP